MRSAERPTPRIALSKDFLPAFSLLPKKIQKKVWEFLEKFQADPTSKGIDFKKPEGVVDPKVRSVRIDQTYRAIVVQPPKGDVYLVVWVDHHDDAYEWARNRKFEVNPVTGSFQIFSAEAVATTSSEPKQSTSPESLFSSTDDEDLLLAGVPLPLLPAVRAVATDKQLEAIKPHLPEDAFEILVGIAAGMGILEALEEADKSTARNAAVDIEDFAAALAQPVSQRQFRVVEHESDLDAMLGAPLQQWRIFLHPSQRELATKDFNGPARVLGGAGTGKTVVLMHRARHLARSVFNGANDRILVTTFTRNLAIDLEQNLRALCGPEFERLAITNLHSWCARFLRAQGHARNYPDDALRSDLMQEARDVAPDLDLPGEFFLEEWERIVLSQEIVDLDGYMRARRTGRGVRIGRAQRQQLWQIFERYRELLLERGYTERQEAVREARALVTEQSGGPPFRAVLADEVQDFTAAELRLLRALAPAAKNDMFLVGDGHQRIYGQPTALSRCGIEIRGRSKRLRLNYRTTESIARQGLAILEGCQIDDLDDGIDTLKGYTSLRHGAPPIVKSFDSDVDEANFVVETVRGWIEGGVAPHEICVATRTNTLLTSRYQPLFAQAGIATTLVTREPESAAQVDGVRLATMHRMKGLEFPRVVLASVQSRTVPLPLPATSDTSVLASHELQERCLFYVACTRARDALTVCGFGTPSEFLT